RFRREITMRADVTITSKGVRCAGWLYRSDDLPEGRRAPAVVMVHGLSAVKEMGLPPFAEGFAAAGFVTLVLDYRFFGASGRERYRTGVVSYLPVVAPDGTPCAVPGQENHDDYLALAADAPAWQNQITLESVGAMREFDPASSLPLLAPTPLLVIAAERDALV